MSGGKIRHWKHGWIPVSPEAKAFVAGRGSNPTAPPLPDRSKPLEVVEATVANDQAISREMTDQGLSKDHPMRGVLTRKYGNTYIVARDQGKIIGGIALDRNGSDVEINEVRVLNSSQRAGTGQKMIAQAARLVKPGGEMKVYGAVDSAKPFYAKTGATFRPESSLGNWSPESIAAMKVGKKPQPGRVLTPADEWVLQLERERKEYPEWYRQRYGNTPPRKVKMPSRIGYGSSSASIVVAV